MTLHVRPATTADSGAIRTVASAAWRDTYAGLLKLETIERFIDRAYALDRLAERIASHTFFVVEEAAEVVAFAEAVEESDLLLLSSIYALPGQRGRGAGTLLLDAIRAEFPGRPLSADVVLGNRKGETFYERRGFTRGEPATFDLFGETVVECRWLLK